MRQELDLSRQRTLQARIVGIPKHCRLEVLPDAFDALPKLLVLGPVGSGACPDGDSVKLRTRGDNDPSNEGVRRPGRVRALEERVEGLADRGKHLRKELRCKW